VIEGVPCAGAQALGSSTKPCMLQALICAKGCQASPDWAKPHLLTPTQGSGRSRGRMWVLCCAWPQRGPKDTPSTPRSPATVLAYACDQHRTGLYVCALHPQHSHPHVTCRCNLNNKGGAKVHTATCVQLKTLPASVTCQKPFAPRTFCGKTSALSCTTCNGAPASQPNAVLTSI
jgi:hypothetical protein